VVKNEAYLSLKEQAERCEEMCVLVVDRLHLQVSTFTSAQLGFNHAQQLTWARTTSSATAPCVSLSITVLNAGMKERRNEGI
jgi:hypothetical protein